MVIRISAGARLESARFVLGVVASRPGLSWGGEAVPRAPPRRRPGGPARAPRREHAVVGRRGQRRDDAGDLTQPQPVPGRLTAAQIAEQVRERQEGLRAEVTIAARTDDVPTSTTRITGRAPRPSRFGVSKGE